MRKRPLKSMLSGHWRLLRPFVALLLGIVAVVPLPLLASQDATATAAASKLPDGEVVLDRVIAVVNNQVILASDLELELRIAHLLPIGERADVTPAEALERLTTRALIEQQIQQEDPEGLSVTPEEVEKSLAELRQSLPACRHRDCASDAGWRAYLATYGLTQQSVSHYWSRRIAVLRFIEERFRSGIRISPDEIEKYYHSTLVPKYASPEDAPPLSQVSQRIQEVLLQQQVNALLTDWLKTLQDQGQVEILDPSLRPTAAVPDTGTSGSDTPPSADVSPEKEPDHERL